MNIPRYINYYLFFLLILVNLIIRIPSIPHEIGNDSFGIHILANSISLFGHANWWTNSLSIFGFYPYSYPSAVPFFLSGLSQTTGVDMERVIWMYSIIIGLFSIFTGYVLAGILWKDDTFKFLIAFLFSLNPGILGFSTWDATTRGLFIILLPLFIFLLIQTQTSLIKYGILSFILFIFLMGVHHFHYFLLPIIISLIIVKIMYKLIYRFKQYFKFDIPNNFFNILLIISYIATFLIPFFTGLFIKGNRYLALHSMLLNNIRYNGILIFLSIPGFIYLIFKNKGYKEWFLMFTLLLFLPIMYVQTYAHFIIIIFITLLIAYSLSNLSKNVKQRNKYAAILMIIFLLASVSFSGFYQHWRTGVRQKIAGEYYNWYMNEIDYGGAIWIKDNIDKNKRIVGNDNWQSKRIFAISEVPVFLEDLGTEMYIYGFFDLKNMTIIKVSPFSASFYMDYPYIIDTKNFILPELYRNQLQYQDVDEGGKGIINKFKLSYVVENQYIGKNKFIDSLYAKEKDSIYDNGKIRLWFLN